MAMPSVIRKASHTVVPLAVRAIAAPRINLSSFVIKAAEHSGESLGFSYLLNFSTVAYALKRCNLKAHPSDIQLPKIPTGFPFEIRDIPGENTIKFTREFAGEKIVVEVGNPINPQGESTTDVSGVGGGDNLSTDSSDDEESEKRFVNLDQTYIPLHVNICKENGRTLKLSFAVDADYIDPREIHFIDEGRRMHDEVKLEDQEDYWRTFIRVRGIDDSIGKFMMDYMNRRKDRDYLIFLEKFRKFMKE